jgi:sulfite exporter TauE/SafE
MQFITPFMIGLFSGFHCVAMCGGLCSLICHKKSTKIVLLANSGRVITYAILGTIFAGIVQGASLTLNLATIGLILRSIMGISLILLGLVLFMQSKTKLLSFSFELPVWNRASSLLNKLNSNQSSSAFILKGMLWGLIPCGLLYGLLLIAATTNNAISGGLFMLFFGLGTLLPMVLSQKIFRYLQHLISIKILRTLSALFIMIIGFWILFSAWFAHDLIPENNPFFAGMAAVLDLCIP